MSWARNFVRGERERGERGEGDVRVCRRARCEQGEEFCER